MAKYDPTLDTLFTALADPTRRAILTRLTRGGATVSELAAPHDMALPTFLKHLGKLESAGLVLTLKAGRTRHCQLAPDALLPAQSWLEDQRKLWDSRLDQFDAYATSLAKDRDT